ncbi:MAG: cyclophilin-like fold protein [Anaerolineae bacterium]
MAERKIRIAVGSVEAQAELDGSKTAQAIWDALPLAAKAETWGDEIYFSIPVHLKEEAPKDVVGMGDLGYWPPGNAFCIFFGPTPASHGEEIRPASPVDVFGRIIGDPKIFKKVRAGATVRIERA